MSLCHAITNTLPIKQHVMKTNDFLMPIVEKEEITEEDPLSDPNTPATTESMDSLEIFVKKESSEEGGIPVEEDEI